MSDDAALAPPTADPADESPIGLAVAAVAQRLGLAPATLRTWHRRYGLGPSGRSIGGHRRYTGADILRLDLTCRLIRQGLAPAEAARLALNSAVDADAAAHALPPFVAADIAAPSTPEQAAATVRGLVRAAIGLDADTCRLLVRASLERRGVIWTWDNVLKPTLIEVGKRWEASGQGVEAEHLLSSVVESELLAHVPTHLAAVNSRPVLLAAAPDELHTLPLVAVGATLAERHIDARLLGARTPIAAVEAAARRLGSTVIVLWSQLAATGNTATVGALANLVDQNTVVLAGPGWTPELPAGVERPLDLVDTVTRVTAAIR